MASRVPVEPTLDDPRGMPGTPSPAPAPTGLLRRGRARRRHPASRLGRGGAARATRRRPSASRAARARPHAAHDAVAALAARLFPGDPPLLLDGGLACRARGRRRPFRRRRIAWQFDLDGVRLAASAARPVSATGGSRSARSSAARACGRTHSSSRSSASSTMRRASPSAAPISMWRGSSTRRTRSRASSTASPGTS